MTSVRTFTSRASRIIVSTLVATIACAVVAPNVSTVRAADLGTTDYAATLNGSSYFQVADNAAFDQTSNMTVEMWIKPGAGSCMTSAVYCQLINKENSYEFGISNGVLQYALTNSAGSWNWYATDATVRQGIWQHIAFVVSRTTSTISVYYNGELSGDTLSSTSVPLTGSNSAGAFTIGNRAAYSETYTGDIDEVRLYSAVRSAANIKTDMYTYGTINATNLVAYYDFNEDSATLVNDAPSAAAGTNLTRYGTVTYTDMKTVTNPTNLYGRTVVTFARSYITSSGGWTVPSGVSRVDALVVAGGGGGGGGQGSDGWSGGGGGGGGLRTLTNTSVTPGSAMTTTPWSSYKNQTKGNSKSTTTNTVATATPVATPFAVTALGATRFNMSAVRLITDAQSKKYIINSLTPKICLGSAKNLAFIHTGKCVAQVVLRSNGKIAKTVTTKVTAGTVEATEEVVPLAAPVVAYFSGGTALVKASSKKEIAALAASAKTASSIIVTGHSGNIGGERANMVKLSQQRASAVRSLLRAKGVGRTIAIWSFGATYPVTNSKSNAQQDLNRRAEIYIIP